MQEPRAVAERRGDLESVAQLSAGGRQASIVVRRRRQVRHEGEIVARSNRGQESVELGGRDGGRWGLMAGEHVLRVLLALGDVGLVERIEDRKSTLNSSHEWISYAVFCLKKKKTTKADETTSNC